MSRGEHVPSLFLTIRPSSVRASFIACAAVLPAAASVALALRERMLATTQREVYCSTETPYLIRSGRRLWVEIAAALRLGAMVVVGRACKATGSTLRYASSVSTISRHPSRCPGLLSSWRRLRYCCHTSLQSFTHRQRDHPVSERANPSRHHRSLEPHQAWSAKVRKSRI